MKKRLWVGLLVGALGLGAGCGLGGNETVGSGGGMADGGTAGTAGLAGAGGVGERADADSGGEMADGGTAGTAGLAGAGGAGERADADSDGRDVSILNDVVAVSAGTHHTCVVLRGGSVQCWGNNRYGQLGNGSTRNSFVPVTVTGLVGATAVSVALYHTCALLVDGAIRCWGANGFGQLGDGTLGDGLTTTSLVPVTVSGLTGAPAVSAITSHNMGGHTCALLVDGAIRCWGANGFGQLGKGSDRSFSITAIPVSGLAGATAVSAADTYTCAVVAGGAVQCWGNSNFFGPLGDGSTTDAPMPVTVSGLTGATAVSAGLTHACALLTGGTVQCWGSSALGDGTDHRYEPFAASVPVTVSTLTGVTAVSAGAYYTCALLASGSVQCWGDNSIGQLGNGTTMGSLVPVPISALSGVTMVSTGGDPGEWGTNRHERLHGTACAVMADGTVRCWGSNLYGALGTGSTMDSLVPVPVSTSR